MIVGMKTGTNPLLTWLFSPRMSRRGLSIKTAMVNGKQSISQTYENTL